ncbi:MAG TPA: T9SS type A sorting domain-containing protein, partial [Bacteroidales bacterium]|nr:T9SS type A sorting domain-containing protein [Bacteroidales bacterium]
GQAVLVSQKLIRSLKITDSRGRTVSSLKPDSYRVKIQEGLSAGLYYISVQAGEQWYVKKFQVVR